MNKNIRLLIVEDSENDAILLVENLKAAGYNPVYERVDTEESFLAALKKNWDVIISDFVMPEFSGLETLRILHDEGLDIPCLIVSGKIDEETAVPAMRGGAKDYIMKDNLKRLSPAIEREQIESEVRQEKAKIAEKLKDMEQVLASGKFAQIILDQAADAIVVCDTEGTILRASEKSCKLFGTNLEGLQFDRVFDQFYPAPGVSKSNARTVSESSLRLTSIKRKEIPSGSEIATMVNGQEKQNFIITYSLLFQESEVLGYSISLTDITERKKAEEKLEESEQRWETTLASIGDAVIATDIQGRVTFMNDVAQELTGWHFEEIASRPVTEIFNIVNEQSRKKADNPVDKVLRQGVICGLANHTVLVRKDGTEFPIDDSGAPIRDQDGNITGVVLIFRDVTERKKSEDALARAKDELEIRVKERTSDLAKSEENYRLLVENANEAVMVFQDNRVKYYNPKAQEIFGYSGEEFASKEFPEFIHPADREMVIERHFKRLKGERVPNSYEFKIIHKGGSFRWVSLNAVPLNWEGNSAALGLITDITERKKSEEELKRKDLELEQRGLEILSERQRLIDMLETLPIMVCLMTPEHQVVFANRAFREQFGESRGRPCYEYVSGIQEPCKGCEAFTPLTTGQQHQWEHTSADGNLVLEVYDFPFNDEDGSPLVLEMNIDITARKKAEAARLKAQKELAQANRQLKQYAHKITEVQEEERKRVAYELHDDTAQYLSILKMQIGALAESGEIQNPRLKERLRLLEKDANRAFNDVRRYSHELRPVVLEHQGLVAALEQIADDFNKLGQLTVEVHIEGKEPELSEAVKLGFFRIAQEALNNTRKHSKASHVNIDIGFNQKQVRMMVNDNGQGFNTREALKKSGGKGSLGLMSMRERADIINADLKIESESGRGTTVNLKAKL
jgi:PAS domain S-box-containing protein